MIVSPQQGKTSSQHSERCALCARKLVRPGTVVPALGVVGPECQKHVGDALAYLQAAGLGALILTGEARIPMTRNADSTLSIPQAALDLVAAGKRVGLSIAGRVQPREWVARLADPRQLLALLKRRAA